MRFVLLALYGDSGSSMVQWFEEHGPKVGLILAVVGLLGLFFALAETGRDRLRRRLRRPKR